MTAGPEEQEEEEEEGRRMSLLCVQPAGCESAAIHRQANLLHDCDEGERFDLNGVDVTQGGKMPHNFVFLNSNDWSRI